MRCRTPDTCQNILRRMGGSCEESFPPGSTIKCWYHKDKPTRVSYKYPWADPLWSLFLWIPGALCCSMNPPQKSFLRDSFLLICCRFIIPVPALLGCVLFIGLIVAWQAGVFCWKTASKVKERTGDVTGYWDGKENDQEEQSLPYMGSTAPAATTTDEVELEEIDGDL